jgi:hypothetical protein
MIIHTFHQRPSHHITSHHFTSLHFTSLHFTSLHFTSLHSAFFTSLRFWTFRHHASKTLYFTHLLFHCLNGSETSGSSRRTTQCCFLGTGIHSYATVKAPKPTAIICYCWTCDCGCTAPAFRHVTVAVLRLPSDIVTDIFFTRVRKQSKKNGKLRKHEFHLAA